MDRSTPPFFGAFGALAVDDGDARTGLASGAFAQLDIERVMDAQQRPVPVPQLQILVHGAARREVLRQGAPLAARREDIENGVQHFAHIDRTLAPAVPGRRDLRRHQRPLTIRQIARITQAATVKIGRAHV